MDPSAKRAVATVIPSLRYRNAKATIEGPCHACGSEEQAMHANGDVVHRAQPTFGSGVVMPRAADNRSAWGKRTAQPDDFVPGEYAS